MFMSDPRRSQKFALLRCASPKLMARAEPHGSECLSCLALPLRHGQVAAILCAHMVRSMLGLGQIKCALNALNRPGHDHIQCALDTFHVWPLAY